ncbi:hypothetical protein EXIGLDRAFT_772955 [Exidia glandulosa HHB12029]|uniref:Protein kinase domain-containing protein n=1 Tax=Exidia glandulosa HHB12029 TaxID=1314781 RepID=A0A165F1D3_EXIGL|nr:hypothetical protein EXIGLDRAFT_772955 [Exidia glandulosa HHB12029]
MVSACGVARLVESTKTIPITEQPRAPTDPEDRLPMTTATDVYAFGWLVFQVLTDIDPFEMVRNPNIMKLIASGVKPNRPAPSTLPWKRGLDDVLWNQCLRCWEISPTERPTMEDVLEVFNVPVAPACPRVKVEQLSGSKAQNRAALQRADAAQDNAAGGRLLCITINAETSLTILGRSSYSLVHRVVDTLNL